MTARVRKLLREEIEARFPTPEGQRTNPGGQRAIAEKMHVSQSWLNQFLQEKKDIGIDMLLGLRAYFAETGRPMTVDELLGLDPIAAKPAPAATETDEAIRTMDAFVERFAALESEVRELQTRGAVAAGVKERARIAVEKAKLAAIGNRDARKSKSSAPTPRRKAG